MVRFHLFPDTLLRGFIRWDQLCTWLQTSSCKSIWKPDPWDERDPQMRNIFGTTTQWHHLFFFLLFLSVQPRFAVFLFVLKRGSSACIKFCLAFTIWCIDLCSVARPQPFILELSSTSSFISHPPLELNDITWGLHLIKVLYSCDGGWHCVGFR